MWGQSGIENFWKLSKCMCVHVYTYVYMGTLNMDAFGPLIFITDEITDLSLWFLC